VLSSSPVTSKTDQTGSCHQSQDHVHLIHTPYPNKSTLAQTHALFSFSFLLIEKLYFAPCFVWEIQFSSFFYYYNDCFVSFIFSIIIITFIIIIIFGEDNIIIHVPGTI